MTGAEGGLVLAMKTWNSDFNMKELVELVAKAQTIRKKPGKKEEEEEAEAVVI